jgi:hypothetical protein
MREEFDAKILAAFLPPYAEDTGTDGTFEDAQEYAGFETAGDLLGDCMVGCVGPTPKRFYAMGLLDNLHGLMEVEYAVRNGRPGYTMRVDRSSLDGPTIFVFEQDGVFDIEVV